MMFCPPPVLAIEGSAFACSFGARPELGGEVGQPDSELAMTT